MSTRSSTSASDRGPAALLLRTSLFAGMVMAALAACVQWGPPAAPSDYMRATVVKHNRLRSIGSPKVVLVGGSNLTYGVDSERMEKAFCKPVANMGLTALLGFRFATNEVVDALGKGDVVIIALENSMFTQPDRYADALATVIDYRPASMHYIPWQRRPRLWAGLGVLHAQSLYERMKELYRSGGLPPVYRKRVFNVQGDMVNQLTEPAPEIPSPDPAEYDTVFVAEAFWPIAEDFVEQARERGAQVIFSWTSVAQRVHDPAETADVEAALRAHGLTVAGHPADYVFPDSLFFDSWYHLHAHGRQLRTERMITDVCTVLAGDCCEN
jgi:hypothetical protein